MYCKISILIFQILQLTPVQPKWTYMSINFSFFFICKNTYIYKIILIFKDEIFQYKKIKPSINLHDYFIYYFKFFTIFTYCYTCFQNLDFKYKIRWKIHIIKKENERFFFLINTYNFTSYLILNCSLGNKNKCVWNCK